MQKIWKVKKPDIALQRNLSSGLGISSSLAQLLINRGMFGFRHFFFFSPAAHKPRHHHALGGRGIFALRHLFAA